MIIIDNKEVFTGSFNFSDAAETKNAENSILIWYEEIVAQYKSYFDTRLARSQTLQENLES